MVDSAVDLADKHIIRVFILDDHELVRRGLTDLLGSTDDIEVVGEAATAGEALRRIPAARRTSPSSMRGCPMAAGSRSAETSARLIPKSAV